MPFLSYFVMLLRTLSHVPCQRFGLPVQARFAKHVFPGETLRTEMWQDGPTRIVFQTRVVERDELALTFAAVELNASASQIESKM